MTSQPWMTIIAAISATISLVSLVATIYYANRTRKDREESSKNQKMANDQAERANEIALGMAENDLLRDIASARRRFEDVAVELEVIVNGRLPTDMSEEDKRKLKPLNLRRISAMEELLNAYENACSKYRDGKVDKDRFKKTYFSEIRNIFEPPDNRFEKLIHPEGTSRFKALWLVYREWYNLEK